MTLLFSLVLLHPHTCRRGQLHQFRFLLLSMMMITVTMMCPPILTLVSMAQGSKDKDYNRDMTYLEIFKNYEHPGK